MAAVQLPLAYKIENYSIRNIDKKSFQRKKSLNSRTSMGGKTISLKELARNDLPFTREPLCLLKVLRTRATSFLDVSTTHNE